MAQVTVEISFAGGDAAVPGPSSWADGMVDQILAPGGLITPAEIVDWFTSGAVPAAWSLMSSARQAGTLRMLKQTKWLTAANRTPEECADRAVPDWTTKPPEDQTRILAEMQDWIGKAEAQRTELMTFGLDTNFGAGVLRCCGVVLLNVSHDALMRYLEDLHSQPEDDTIHEAAPYRPKARRRYLFPYWNLLDATTVANIRDPGVYVAVDRAATPFTVADLELVT